MDIRKALMATLTITCIAIGTASAQTNPDPSNPPTPAGIPLPGKTDVAPNNSADTSRAAHRRPVKPPKEPQYDGKTVTPRGSLTKKPAKKTDEKDMPK